MKMMGFIVLDDVVKTTGSVDVVNMVKLTDRVGVVKEVKKPGMGVVFNVKTGISPIFAHWLYVRPNL